MSEYRIKKGGREFSATQLKTLQQLAARGLLRSGDPVSVDGAPFRPASEIPGLGPHLAGAAPDDTSTSVSPWRHWGQDDLDSETGTDSVLSSFLDQISSEVPSRATRSGKVAVVGSTPAGLPRSRPGAAPASRPGLGSESGSMARINPAGSEPTREPPLRDPSATNPSLRAVVPAPEPVGPRWRSKPGKRTIPKVSQALKPLKGDARSRGDHPSLSPVGGFTAPSSEELAAIDDAALAAADATLADAPRPASPDGAPAPELPVSFTEWLENRGEGDTESPLEGFGRYDDGIFTRSRRASALNPFRVLLLVLLGVGIIGMRWMWVRTVAQTAYPLESELEQRIAGTRALKPSEQVRIDEIPLEVATPEQQPIEAQRQMQELEMRQALSGALLDFSTPEQLEDSFFKELINRGAMPMTVTVESIRTRGSNDKDHRRPTQANLSIALGGVRSAGDAGYEQLEERLLLCWLLVGKYGTQGRVVFEDVEIRIAPPLPWSQHYQGSRLESFWSGQLQADDLFPD